MYETMSARLAPHICLSANPRPLRSMRTYSILPADESSSRRPTLGVPSVEALSPITIRHSYGNEGPARNR